MSEIEFSTQMNRLAETFGKAAYGTERVKLIWKEVGALNVDWFKSLIDLMIGTMRQAPLLPDFHDAVLRERERIWQETKQDERHAAKTWTSQFSAEDEKMMSQTILKRLKREISDDDWASFQNLLKRMESA